MENEEEVEITMGDIDDEKFMEFTDNRIENIQEFSESHEFGEHIAMMLMISHDLSFLAEFVNNDSEDEVYEETLNWLLGQIKETALNMRDAVGENPLEEVEQS